MKPTVAALCCLLTFLLAAVDGAPKIVRRQASSSTAIANCQSNSNPPFQCKNCGSGTVHSKDFKACIPCPANCQTCNDVSEYSSDNVLTGTAYKSECTICKSGYTLEKADTEGAMPTCKPCALNCLKCDTSGSGNCDESQCVVGYVLTENKCNKCGTKCDGCDTNKQGKCDSGKCQARTVFNPDTTKLTCESCPSNCQSCQLKTGSSTTTCDAGKCDVGFAKKGTDDGCTACSSNCLECTDGDTVTCTKCADRFVLNNGVCTACAPNCKTCSTSGECDVCDAKFGLKGKTCSACPTLCWECTFEGETATCAKCPSNYGIITQDTCDPCPENCLKCGLSDGKTQCLDGECAGGFARRVEDGTCHACPANCDGCNYREEEGRTFCNVGACKDRFIDRISDGNCYDCPSKCKRCTDDGSKTKCVSTECDAMTVFDVVTSNCLDCGTSCASCYINSDNQKICSECVAKFAVSLDGKSCKACPANCDECFSEMNANVEKTKCYDEGCNDEYRLQSSNSKCVSCGMAGCKVCTDSDCLICLDGYVLLGTGSCQLCPAQCAPGECDAAGACTLCNDGYQLDSNGICQPCSIGAKKCTYQAGVLTTDVDSCYANYIPNRNTKKCVAGPTGAVWTYDSSNHKFTSGSCSSGYVKAHGTCHKCMPNCDACDFDLVKGETVCTTCATGYTLNTGQCDACDSNCDACDSAGKTNCDTGSCTGAYYLANSKCVGCPTGCSGCSAADTCTTCLDGYDLSSGVCVSCKTSNTNCKTCDAATPGTCTACKDGYALADSGSKCLPCPQGCSVCEATSTTVTQCKLGQCKAGFIMSCSKVCQPCPSGCGNCYFPAASSTTKCYSGQCKYGFAQDPTTKECHPCPNDCNVCYYEGGTTKCDSDGCRNKVPVNFLGLDELHYFQNTDLTCSACAADCNLCSVADKCDTVGCIDGYWYQSTTETCLACSHATVHGANCLQCDATECTACEAGYFLKSDRTSTTACEDCADATNGFKAGCSICSSAACSACSTNYILTTPGAAVGAAACFDCADTTNGFLTGCNACTTTACTGCSTNYFLKTPGATTGNAACSDCEDTTNGFNTGCAACSATQCTACDAANYFSDASAAAGSRACTACDPTCSTCDGTADTDCTGCVKGKCVVSSGKCQENTCAHQPEEDFEETGYDVKTNPNLQTTITGADVTCTLSDKITGCLYTEYNSQGTAVCPEDFCIAGTMWKSDSCTLCPTGCANCYEDGTTLKCKNDGCAYLTTVSQSGSKCLSCPVGCQECKYDPDNPETVAICTVPGVGADPPHSCLTGFWEVAADICLACHDNMKTCTLNDDHEIEGTTCDAGFVLHDNECFPCAERCDVCTFNSETTQTTCVTCADRSVMGVNGDTTCYACSEGCKQCEFDSTLTGVIRTRCKGNQCDVGYGQHVTEMTCHSCVDGCDYCSYLSSTGSSHQFSCLPGKCRKTWMYEAETTGRGICKGCTSDCARCKETSKCNAMTCQVGYAVVKSGSSQGECKTCGTGCKECTLADDFTPTCTSCDTGYVRVGSVCQKCADKCNSCQIQNQCNPGACHDGYVLNDEKTCSKCPVNAETCQNSGGTVKATKCLSLYGLTSSFGCDKCADNCLSCTNAGKCDVCEDAFVLSNEKCDQCGTNCKKCSKKNECDVGECQARYRLDNGKCESCPEKCEKCDSEKGKCDSGQCDSGYFRNADGECKACIDNCATCSDDQECTTCNPRYTTDTKKQCQSCPSLCATCDISLVDGNEKLTCSACDGKYTVNSGVCGRCPTNCLECQNAPLSCTKCEPNFVLDNSGQCVACPSNCDIDSCTYSNAAAVCNKCIPGYNFNADTKCEDCSTVTGVANCDQCSSHAEALANGATKAECLKCRSSFTLKDDKSECLSCGALENCAECEDIPNICTTCNTPFVPTKDGQQCLYSCYLCSGEQGDCPQPKSDNLTDALLGFCEKGCEYTKDAAGKHLYTCSDDCPNDECKTANSAETCCCTDEKGCNKDGTESSAPGIQQSVVTILLVAMVSGLMQFV